MSLRMSPKEAAERGLISQAEAQRMEAARRGTDPRVLRAPLPTTTPSADGKAEGKPKSAGPIPTLGKPAVQYGPDSIPPQQILFDALCERLPGRPEWEKEGLVPGRKFRADIFIPPDVVVEMDGYQHHTAKKAYQKDRERGNLLVAQGYRVFHAYTKQVRDDEKRRALVELIASAVESPVYRFPSPN